MKVGLEVRKEAQSKRPILNSSNDLNYSTSNDLRHYRSISIIYYKKYIRNIYIYICIHRYMYVKLTSPPGKCSSSPCHTSNNFSDQKWTSQDAVYYCSPLSLFSVPLLSGGCSLQLNVQMLLMGNEGAYYSVSTEEGWVSTPLSSLKQGSACSGFGARRGHVTLFSD